MFPEFRRAPQWAIHARVKQNSRAELRSAYYIGRESVGSKGGGEQAAQEPECPRDLEQWKRERAR
jgi:hypothetical protein